MGSSYFPALGLSFPPAPTGPSGPKGNTGSIGPTGYGSTGNTGPSVVGMGICGDKLRTYFSDGSTYQTTTSFKGETGNVVFTIGMSAGNGLSIYSGLSYDSNTLNFRTIKGTDSSSGRANVSVTLLSDSTIKIDYSNSSSDFGIGITGATSIGTFVGYSGNTLISLPKTSYDIYSSFLTRNVIEKTRGLGFSGATSISGSLCNYITGGTFFYVNESGFSAETNCKVLHINPFCISGNEVDVRAKNNMFVADMQQNTTLVKIHNSDNENNASAISLLLFNANNGPTAISIGQARFQAIDGNVLWPFNAEPCFCGNTGTNLYHFYNLGGSTWYGSIAFLSNVSGFDICQRTRILGLSVQYGACCINDGSSGGTCSYESMGDCFARGSSAYWHAGLTCGSNPCQKTGGCFLYFTDQLAIDSSLCLNGITCINCISGRVYDSNGNTYNANSFVYLGNGVTCSYSDSPVEV